MSPEVNTRKMSNKRLRCAAIFRWTPTSTDLYAISKHGTGASRDIVGVMPAGTTWNIIPCSLIAAKLRWSQPSLMEAHVPGPRYLLDKA
jgi:hypothetical protein